MYLSNNSNIICFHVIYIVVKMMLEKIYNTNTTFI